MDTKAIGNIAVVNFMSQAMAEEYNIFLPFGDSSVYDVLLEKDGKFIRVEVKKASKVADNRFDVNCSQKTAKGKVKKYKNNDFDFIAAYIDQCDCFYIIPIDVFLKLNSTLKLSPFSYKSKYTKYKEAWKLLEEYNFNK